MNLTPEERDKLLISIAAVVARGRLERGGKLNHPWPDLMAAGAHVVMAEQCMEGIASMIHNVQVKATIRDGTKLVTVHHPIR